MSNWKIIQQRTFTNWFNDRLRGNLKESKVKVNDLETDLADGILLILLLENLAKPRKVGHYNRNSRNKLMSIENLGIALKFIKSENIKLVNIGPEDIHGCNLKLILGLIWTLICHYQIRSTGKGLSTKQAMKEWLHTLIPEHNIQNFNTNWNDGRAVCGLVDSLQPGLCPNHLSLNPSDGLDNCRLGMELAEKHLQVPMILDPEDMNNPEVDELSVMTYISYFFDPARNVLLQWVQQKIPEKKITNFSTDWNNGINLAALMEACHKGIMTDLNSLEPQNALGNLEKCVDLAKTHLDIECPVSPAALSDPNVDEIVVATYLSRFKYSKLLAKPNELSIKKPDFGGAGCCVVRDPVEIPLDLGENPGLILPDLSITAKGPSADSVVNIDSSAPNQIKAKFTPTEAGKYEVSCKINNEGINGSPLIIPVIDPKQWAVTPPEILFIEKPAQSDVKGPCYGGAPTILFEIADKDGSPSCNLTGSIAEVKPENHKLTLTASDIGAAEVRVTVAGKDVTNSPFTVFSCDPTKSKVSGIDTGNAAITGKPIELEIDNTDCGKVHPVVTANTPTKTYTPDVQRTDDDDKYKSSFIPTEPGDHVVDVTLAGDHVPGSPFRLPVSAGDPDSCSARGPGLSRAVAGRPAKFIIITPEKGLLSKDPNALTVDIINADKTIKVENSIEDLQDQTYGVTYTVPVEGEYYITIKVFDTPIPGCDFKVTALPKPDPTKCRVYGPSLHPNALLLSDRPLEIYVDTKVAGHGELKAVAQGPKNTVPKIFMADDNGIYNLRVDCKKPGRYRINIWWADVHIPKSPIVLKVHKAPDASKVRAFGPGVSPQIDVHRPAEFTILTRNAGVGTLTVVVHGIKDAFDVQVRADDPADRRTLKCTYHPQEGGDYEVTIKWSNVEIPGSPFLVKVVDRQKDIEERQKHEKKKKRISVIQDGAAIPINPTYKTGGGLTTSNPTMFGMMKGGGASQSIRQHTHIQEIIKRRRAKTHQGTTTSSQNISFSKKAKNFMKRSASAPLKIVGPTGGRNAPKINEAIARNVDRAGGSFDWMPKSTPYKKKAQTDNSQN
jgi:filamin